MFFKLLILSLIHLFCHKSRTITDDKKMASRDKVPLSNELKRRPLSLFLILSQNQGYTDFIPTKYSNFEQFLESQNCLSHYISCGVWLRKREAAENISE